MHGMNIKLLVRHPTANRKSASPAGVQIVQHYHNNIAIIHVRATFPIVASLLTLAKICQISRSNNGYCSDDSLLSYDTYTGTTLDVSDQTSAFIFRVDIQQIRVFSGRKVECTGYTTKVTGRIREGRSSSRSSETGKQ
jgi:hypothetical protein